MRRVLALQRQGRGAVGDEQRWQPAHSITGAASLEGGCALSNLGRRSSMTIGMAITLRIIMSLKSLLKAIMDAWRVTMPFSITRSWVLERSVTMGDALKAWL